LAQAGEPAGDDNIAETIDVSSVLGDLLQEPTDPRQAVDAEEPERDEPLPDPRGEPMLNFAFDTPVPPVHEPPGHPPRATHPSDVHVEQHRPHAPASAAADRAPGQHAFAHDDDDGEQIAASFRPKRSRLAAPVLRMTAFVITIAALAIVVILAVSGVWDPRGPELNLPSSANQGGGAALPSAAPAAPVAETPPAADTPPPAVSTAETPAPAAAPAASAAPAVAPTTAATTAPTTATAPAAAPAPTTTTTAPKPAPPPRESSASRRRGSATEAAGDPREACAGRSQFALYRCMQAQCARTRWAAHPECVRLRKSDRVDPS
jgi:hypothetical protein